MSFRATAIRRFATKMTEKERDQAMRVANEKMRDYYTKRPPIDQIRRRTRQKNSSEHLLQMGLAGAFLVTFVCSPFLGRRIAQDEEFRKSFIPSWYDFTLTKPEHAWTRQELHEQMVELQRELHERAIRGDFTPEKLDEMRRHFEGVDPKEDTHGWGKLHPGVDDDEDLEDD